MRTQTLTLPRPTAHVVAGYAATQVPRGGSKYDNRGRCFYKGEMTDFSGKNHRVPRTHMTQENTVKRFQGKGGRPIGGEGQVCPEKLPNLGCSNDAIVLKGTRSEKVPGYSYVSQFLKRVTSQACSDPSNNVAMEMKQEYRRPRRKSKV